MKKRENGPPKTNGRDLEIGTPERMTAAQELQTSKQRMEALGVLAGGIAHDFNNILGVVIGFTQLVMAATPEGDPAKSHLEEIMRACHRANDLVAQITTFSRQVDHDRSPLVLSTVVKEAVKFLKASLPSDIEIRQEIDISEKAGTGMVLAEPTRIHQVVMNLCTNAAHAMKGAGGILRVCLADADIDTAAALHAPDLKPGPYMHLAVTDTGEGIDPAIIGRIFEPYVTTKQGGEGAGLGLAVVHGIVKAYDGAVTAKSARGKGTTFHVYLPRIEDSAPLDEGSCQPAVSGTERILFVDDEAVMGRMWRMLLEPLGYRVTISTGSVDALEIFQNQPAAFDLVITDLSMPNMSGTELAARLLEVRPDIPILLCSGFSRRISADEIKAMGIRELLRKPLAPGPLTAAIRRAAAK